MKTIFSRTRWLLAVTAILAAVLLICSGAFAQSRSGDAKRPTNSTTVNNSSGAQIPKLLKQAFSYQNERDPSTSAAEWLERFYRPRAVSPNDYAKAAAAARGLPSSPLLQGRKFAPAGPLTSQWVFQALSPMWNDWGSPPGGWDCNNFPYPDNVSCGASARTEAIAVDPTNANIVYVASYGGLSKSTDGGGHWAYISDGLAPQASQAFRCIAIDPNHSNIIYAGTGTNEYFGVGIYRSTNSGSSWALLGQTQFTAEKVMKIAIDPNNSATLYASVTKQFPVPARHWVWKSTDSGSTWSSIRGPTSPADGSFYALYDIAIQVVGPPGPTHSVIYVTAPDGVYKGSGDGNWTNTTPSGVVTGSATLPLALTQSSALYLAFKTAPPNPITKIVKSTDQGSSWTELLPRPCTPDSQCADLYTFGVNPADPNQIFIGGGQVFVYSVNGGTTWDWARNVHVDNHSIAFCPSNSQRDYLGTDGGVYRADLGDLACDPAHPMCWWSKNQNLASSLMNGISISSDDHMVMGNSDNGTQRGWSGRSPGPPWEPIHGGDGWRPKIHQTNSNQVYYQPGYWLAGNFWLAGQGQWDLTPSGAVSECKYFFPGMYVAPADFNHVVLGFENVYRKTTYCTTDCGNAWTRLGTGPGSHGPTGCNDPATQLVTALCESPTNSNVLYAVLNTLTISVTSDATNWRVTGFLPGTIRAVTVPSGNNDQWAYAASDAGVYKTTNQGTSWAQSAISNLIYYDVVIDPNHVGYLYAACNGDLVHGGVLTSTNGGGSWAWMSDGIPAGVAVTSLSYNPTSRQLAASTLGRGAYILDLDDLPPTVAITAPPNGASVHDTVTVSANASDNHRVVGVQFKLDGSNLGNEVTVPPYSISWNTWTTTQGTHTLTAVARDPAGLMTTSAPVTVTVKQIQ
jgi:hypothetical protein